MSEFTGSQCQTLTSDPSKACYEKWESFRLEFWDHGQLISIPRLLFSVVIEEDFKRSAELRFLPSLALYLTLLPGEKVQIQFSMFPNRIQDYPKRNLVPLDVMQQHPPPVVYQAFYQALKVLKILYLAKVADS